MVMELELRREGIKKLFGNIYLCFPGLLSVWVKLNAEDQF